MQELLTEEKEDYLSRAILLMHSQSMVGIVMEMEVFFYNCTSQEEGEEGSGGTQYYWAVLGVQDFTALSFPWPTSTWHLASLRTSYFCDENYFAVISVIYDISLHCTDLLLTSSKWNKF